MEKQTIKQEEKMIETLKVDQTQSKQEENTMLMTVRKSIEQQMEQIKSLLSSQTQPNQIVINNKIRQLIKLQIKFHSIKQLYLESNEEKKLIEETNTINLNQNETQKQNKKQSLQQNNQTQKQAPLINNQKEIALKIQIIQKESDQYEPTIQQILEKKQSILEEMNDDGWTDATQSETGTLNDDNLMVLDDDMLDQLIGRLGQDEDKQSEDEKSQQQVVDLNQLEDEFVTGQQSNEDYKFGEHKDKFCVSVCSVLKEGLVISGGGDDKLNIYKFKPLQQQLQNVKKQDTKQIQVKQSQVKQDGVRQAQIKHQKQVKQQPQGEQIKQKQPQTTTHQLISPIKIIPHHQTIDMVDLSFDKENVFSLTQKQLICTNLKTLEFTKVQMDTPSHLTCHKQGGVFAVANAFNVQVFNIKGFKFYDSYCLDQEVNILKWTLNGKQLVAACDNKLRIITPKTQQVIKVTGTAFHQGQITVMSLLETTVFTGCIDGYVFASNLTKGHILGSIPRLQATINTLYAAENYLIVGPAQNNIFWYDSNKLKQIFTNEIRGSSTDIIQLATKNQYAISDIQGDIHLFDKRTPMTQKFLLKAGNTVHQLYHDDNTLLAACQDGCVRGWDLRKYQF